MILFLFNSLDPFICKKLGHFIFLAFEKLESRRFHIAVNKVRIFLVIMAIIIVIIIIYSNKCYFLFSPFTLT